MTDTPRADKSRVIKQTEDDTKHTAQGTAAVNGAFARATTGYGCVTINSPDTVLFCLQSAADMLGEEHVKLDTESHLRGRDFNEYVSYMSGAYVYVGVATGKDNGTFRLYGNNSMLEGPMIPKMTAVFAQFAVDFLEKGGLQPSFCS